MRRIQITDEISLTATNHERALVKTEVMFYGNRVGSKLMFYLF